MGKNSFKKNTDKYRIMKENTEKYWKIHKCRNINWNTKIPLNDKFVNHVIVTMQELSVEKLLYNLKYAEKFTQFILEPIASTLIFPRIQSSWPQSPMSILIFQRVCQVLISQAHVQWVNAPYFHFASIKSIDKDTISFCLLSSRLLIHFLINDSELVCPFTVSQTFDQDSMVLVLL